MNKKVKRFVEENFPPFSNMEVIREDKDRTIVELDYGRREPKVQVEVGKFNDSYGLISTEFIEQG